MPTLPIRNDPESILRHEKNLEYALQKIYRKDLNTTPNEAFIKLYSIMKPNEFQEIIQKYTSEKVIEVIKFFKITKEHNIIQ